MLLHYYIQSVIEITFPAQKGKPKTEKIIKGMQTCIWYSSASFLIIQSSDFTDQKREQTIPKYPLMYRISMVNPPNYFTLFFK